MTVDVFHVAREKLLSGSEFVVDVTYTAMQSPFQQAACALIDTNLLDDRKRATPSGGVSRGAVSLNLRRPGDINSFDLGSCHYIKVLEQECH